MNGPIDQIAQKLRDARSESGLSLRELAQRADVSASLLSKLENGKLNPSVRTLHSIAEALSMPVSQLFPETQMDDAEAPTDTISYTPGQVRTSGIEIEHEEISAGPIVRSGEGQRIELMGGVAWERLTAKNAGEGEFLKCTYRVGASSGEKMSHHRGREFHYILRGELTLALGFEQYVLTTGDTIMFNSETPHRLLNTGDTELQILSVIFD